MNIREMENNHEAEQTVAHAWIFDVDGVITDPSEKRITEPELLDLFINELESGNIITFNTGRSMEFLKEKVLALLKARVVELGKDPHLLGRVFAVGEKGGVTVEFDEKGSLVESQDPELSVPQDLQEEVRILVNDRYSRTMFYDTTKRTMISVEMHDGLDVEDFHKDQVKLEEEMRKILQERKLLGQLKIDPTTIATDIENAHVGKHLGARKVLEWLERKGIKPQLYITVGDSKSDEEMADEFVRQGKNVVFVFVGRSIDAIDRPYKIIQTDRKFSQGTLDFLKNPNHFLPRR